jgi:1-acyl-sn-glycerol-3-phosphate acyltransferase
VLLSRLGVPKLWREDPVVAWEIMRYWVSPATMWLAPSHAYGTERVPLTGGAVLAANHLSGIDPPLVGALSPRAIRYMVKADLFGIPVVGELFGWAGGFAVRRGASDREALRTARRLVASGQVVGVFVEGTRQRLGYPGPIHSGAMMVAMREGVPVIPCGLESFGWNGRNRRRCAVVWGEPIDLGGLPLSGQGYRQAAAIVTGEILRLWRQAAEAIVAGFPLQLADGTKRSNWVRPGVPFQNGHNRQRYWPTTCCAGDKEDLPLGLDRVYS